ncbi:MAG: PstS family phosphate ABC transporter substrate-binding protein [Chloroflexaceae bacterium]|nr:PstS family phosphate ABC transporter substrate-binding protein [Chloroflexaceae bacterium]
MMHKRLIALLMVLALVVPILAACGGGTQQPAAEEPAAEEPAAEEPAVEEPTVEEPVAEEPATEEPAAEEPAAAGELPIVNPAEVEGDITAAGSSTVFPLAERIASEFTDEGYAGQIAISSIGSGAGFERFCVAAETDISNASRPIDDEEIAQCQANGRDPIGFLLGLDALSVVVSGENDFIEEVTLEELATIFSTAETWADVRPEWPAEPIQRFSPGTDSGTFDYFIEEVFDEDPAPLLEASGLQQSEDDNVLVQGVEGSPFAIGFFGYAFYEQEGDALRALAIEGVEPSAETVEAGEYPLARPLFMYTTADIMTEKPQVASFINYSLSIVNNVINDVGYFPASEENLNTSRQKWLAVVEGGEAPEGGLTVAEERGLSQ